MGAILDGDFGIAVRVGVHCAPMVHRDLGTIDRGAVRFSLGVFTTADDIDRAIAAMRAIPHPHRPERPARSRPSGGAAAASPHRDLGPPPAGRMRVSRERRSQTRAAGPRPAGSCIRRWEGSMTAPATPPASGAAAAVAGPAWHTLTVDDALAQQGVTAAGGSPRPRRRPASRQSARTVRRGQARAALARVPAPVRRPDADRAARRRHRLLLHPRPGPDRAPPHHPHAASTPSWASTRRARPPRPSPRSRG